MADTTPPQTQTQTETDPGHAHEHDHAHDHGHDHAHAEDSAVVCCSHHDIEIENHEKTIIVGLIAGVLVLIGGLADWLGFVDSEIAKMPAGLGALLLGAPLFWGAWQDIRKMRVSTSSLASLAILGAIAMGMYVFAGFLALVLLVADQLLRRTAVGAQRAIEALVKLTPDEARVLLDDGTEDTLPISRVAEGMVVRIRPGENLPVDGAVMTGRSSINQASLTGESMPVEVQPGSVVYAGTTNLTGTIDLRVTGVGDDTTIGKVAELVREAESTRTPRQLMIEQVARFFVPVALSVAAIVWFLNSQSSIQEVQDRAALTALTVLVVACPASLLISSPVAMMAAFASAARLGIMVKRPSFLEASATVDAVVFDKTGTLTTGVFGVTRLIPAEGVEGADLLTAAANAEQHSNHPLARSIMQTAEQARVPLEGSDDYEEVHGRGVRTRVGAGELHVGRATWLRELSPGEAGKIEGVESKLEGMTGVHVMRDGRYLGAVALEDKLRPNTRGVIDRTRNLGVRLISIFTGDRLPVARRVGVAVGADAIEAECLPEEKHQQVRALHDQGYRVMMIGDGINDGPSLAEADVGVAMGLSGSDIATNSAGVALMTDDLSRVPYLIELARRTRAIIGQNIAGSIVIAIIGLALSSAGVFAMAGETGAGVLAGVYHVIGEVFVIANSFRLFRFGDSFAQAEAEARERDSGGGASRRAGSVRLTGAAQPA